MILNLESVFWKSWSCLTSLCLSYLIFVHIFKYLTSTEKKPNKTATSANEKNNSLTQDTLTFHVRHKYIYIYISINKYKFYVLGILIFWFVLNSFCCCYCFLGVYLFLFFFVCCVLFLCLCLFVCLFLFVLFCFLLFVFATCLFLYVNLYILQNEILQQMDTVKMCALGSK